MIRSAHMFGLSWERKPRPVEYFQAGTECNAQKQFLVNVEDTIASSVDILNSIARYQKTIGYAYTPLDFVRGIGLYLMPNDMALHPGMSRGTTTRSRLPDWTRLSVTTLG